MLLKSWRCEMARGATKSEVKRIEKIAESGAQYENVFALHGIQQWWPSSSIHMWNEDEDVGCEAIGNCQGDVLKPGTNPTAGDWSCQCQAPLRQTIVLDSGKSCSFLSDASKYCSARIWPCIAGSLRTLIRQGFLLIFSFPVFAKDDHSSSIDSNSIDRYKVSICSLTLSKLEPSKASQYLTHAVACDPFRNCSQQISAKSGLM